MKEETNEYRANFDDFDAVSMLYKSHMKDICIFRNKNTNKMYLVTLIQRSDVSPKKVNQFIEFFMLLKSVKHGALLSPLGYFYPNPGRSYQYMFFSDIPKNGTLSDLVNQISLFSDKSILTRSQIFKIIFGIIHAIKQLHENGIIHGDIRLSTVYLDEAFCPHLGSYAVHHLVPSVNLNQDYLDNQMFLAPEFHNNLEFTEKTDIFAFGMLLFRILSKDIYFKKTASRTSFSVNIIQGLRPLLPPSIPPFLRDIIGKSWAHNPDERPSIFEIEAQLKESIQLFCSSIIDSTMIDYLNQLSEGSNSDSSSTPDRAPLSPTKKETNEINNLVNEIYDFEGISKNGKDRARMLIIIQEMFLSIDDTSFEKIAELTMSSIKVRKISGIELIVSTILTSCGVRYSQIRSYGAFFKVLIDKSNHNNLNHLLKPYLIDSIFIQMTKTEPYPYCIPSLNLLRWCLKLCVYTESEIVSSIHAFYGALACKKNICPAFAWFAPEISRIDPVLFQSVLSIFQYFSNNEFFPSVYKDFYSKFDYYSTNNWEYYDRNICSDNEEDSLVKAIRNDDLHLFQNYSKDMEYPIKNRIEGNVFEPCILAHDGPFVPMYAALYGATKIFQFIQMVGSVFYSKDRNHRSVGIAAVAGGHPTIIRLAEQLHCDFSGSIQVAAHFHRNKVFLKLLSGKESELNEPDRFGKPIITSAASNNNIFGILYCIKIGAITQSMESFGWTPLHAATEKGRNEAVSILLEIESVNINAKDIWE